MLDLYPITPDSKAGLQLSSAVIAKLGGEILQKNIHLHLQPASDVGHELVLIRGATRQKVVW
ncbi:MAG: hypothetical protein ACE5JO_03870, partial [Candidatus Binatia bacterium]